MDRIDELNEVLSKGIDVPNEIIITKLNEIKKEQEWKDELLKSIYSDVFSVKKDLVEIWHIKNNYDKLLEKIHGVLEDSEYWRD